MISSVASDLKTLLKSWRKTMDYKKKMQAVSKIIQQPNMSLWAIDYWNDVYFRLAKAEINETQRVSKRIH